MEKTNETVAAENKMGSMPVGKLLFVMAAPMVASMLFQALYNIVDSIFVAKLSQDAMNAVSLAFPFQMLAMGFANGIGVGMNALLSRSLGQKRKDLADQSANNAIFLYIICSVVFAVLALSLARTFYSVQTDNQKIVEYGTSYIKICMGLSCCLYGQVCFERILQSTGRTDLAMIPQVVGAGLNMILDPIMIFGLLGFPRMEVAGAALATVCGQFVSTIVGIILNIKYNKEVSLSFKAMKPVPAIIKEIFRIGVPSIVMQCVGSVMNFCINNILISFTEAATAVFGAYYKIQSFIFLPVFGLNGAMVPIVSYNYGASKMDRYKKVIRLSVFAAVFIMCVGTLIFETIPGLLINLFSPTAEMLEVGKVAFRVIGIHFPLAGFCIVTTSVCQALGRPMYSLIASLMRQLVVLLPSAYLLSLTGKLALVWFSFPIAELMSLLMCVIFLKKTLREVKAEHETENAMIQ